MAVLQADYLATWFLRLYLYPNPLPHALQKCGLLCFPLAASAKQEDFEHSWNFKNSRKWENFENPCENVSILILVEPLFSFGCFSNSKRIWMFVLPKSPKKFEKNTCGNGLTTHNWNQKICLHYWYILTCSPAAIFLCCSSQCLALLWWRSLLFFVVRIWLHFSQVLFCVSRCGRFRPSHDWRWRVRCQCLPATYSHVKFGHGNPENKTNRERLVFKIENCLRMCWNFLLNSTMMKLPRWLKSFQDNQNQESE